MSYIETNEVKNTTTLRFYSEREEVQLDPEYQRKGGIWTLEKRQLLIDSIINEFDIPKLYVHVYDNETKNKTGYSYAVIDGRQRIETIWKFIEGEFRLADDFVYLEDPKLELAGLTYEDIGKYFPKIQINFDSFVLPIVGVRTDDIDLIEDMFSRLNEAVPLNAAEKRNAFGGDMVRALRNLSSHEFFMNRIRVPDRRYQHMEILARFFLLEYQLSATGKITDTKKEYLDFLAKYLGQGSKQEVQSVKSKITKTLDVMVSNFSERDELLSAQGNITIYFLLIRKASRQKELGKVSREKIARFLEEVRSNRIAAENEYAQSNFDLLEYDRLTQQGTNDASNIKQRLETISRKLLLKKADEF